MNAFGYKDYERPKSKKNFDFKGLDYKAIRIMNRLALFIWKKMEEPIKKMKKDGHNNYQKE